MGKWEGENVGAATRAGTRRLLLVRHGLPDYRDRKAQDEPPGPPLSALGLIQAHQAAEALRGCGAATVYCSPLARARQTAECVCLALEAPLVVDSDLKEWHRTESLFDVSQRSARWLVRWRRRHEPCAVVVSHASPLLAILRTALYLPHVGWWKPGQPEQLELSSADRFELSMASICAVTFAPAGVTAEIRFHPDPRIVDAQRRPLRGSFPRPVFGSENTFVQRQEFGPLYGYRPADQ